VEMILTTVAFLLLTVFVTARHLKKTEGARSAPAAKPAGPPCLRCGKAVPPGATFCPGCGVSQQVFELVSAKHTPATAPEAAPSGGRLHAMVRADVCVGCGTCVAACPETGAVALHGKLAVVNKEACVAHGLCVEACPVGAILMTTGESVHRVEVPDVGAGFQTNVPGVYIVGELGGRGLIKNAINEGALAIEHIARELPPSAPRTDGDTQAVDIAIVGSGPAGLSAGLGAHLAGLSYVILEQGNLADSVRKYPRHKILLAETSRVPVYGRLWVGNASKETLLNVWEAIIAENGLKILTGRRVEEISSLGGMFLLRAGQEVVRARRVVLAMGRRGTPRRLGVAGEDLPNVYYDIVEMEAFASRRVVVAGGGDSAAESALGLANQEGTTVHLVHRGERFGRMQASLQTKLAKAVAERRVTLTFSASIREIHQDFLILDVGGRPHRMPYDDLIIRVGGEAPVHMLESLGIRIVRKDIPLFTPDETVAS
jgi:thioredoxin reductase/NAD-dependent dihydropyrimidine dehydrogenase PreA subunit